MQVTWSPVDAQSCAVVSESGQLLLGVLGKQLAPLQSASEASCAAWKRTGRFLAYGFGNQVHVYDLERQAIRWSTKVSSVVLQVMVQLQCHSNSMPHSLYSFCFHTVITQQTAAANQLSCEHCWGSAGQPSDTAGAASWS